MLLRITNHTPDAREIGHLLHKNPARSHEVALSWGSAVVFYPEAEETRTTAVLLTEVDPIGLVRRPPGGEAWSLGQYVNDRPYTASSFLCTAMSEAFGTALNRRCAKRPDLVERVLNLELNVPVAAAAAGEAMMKRLFEPLGYAVRIDPWPLEPAFPQWGGGRLASLTLRGEAPVWLALRHLFVLVPALDRAKHYYVGDDEVEKLLAKGEGWLPGHPEKEWITARYLKYQKRLTRFALARLAPEEANADDDAAPSEDDGFEKEMAAADAAEPQENAPGETVEKAVGALTNTPAENEPRFSLHDQRLRRVTQILKERAPASVLDLGCGEGKLLRHLLRDTRIARITGMDVSSRALEIAREKLERLPPRARQRVTLLHGSLVYRDARLEGYDAAALVEVIEHLDPFRLASLEQAVFAAARPACVVVTTPNRDYNAVFENLAAGAFRHSDHRFEWTRAEFTAWAEKTAAAHGYVATFEDVGEVHPEHGAPSQVAIFERQAA